MSSELVERLTAHARMDREELPPKAFLDMKEAADELERQADRIEQLEGALHGIRAQVAWAEGFDPQYQELVRRIQGELKALEGRTCAL